MPAERSEFGGMRSPKKVFHRDGVLSGVDTNCFIPSDTPGRKHTSQAYSDWNHWKEICFPCSVSDGIGRGAHQVDPRSKRIRAEAEKSGIAFAFRRHRIAFTGLKKTDYGSRGIALEMNVRVGALHGGNGRLGVERPLM